MCPCRSILLAAVVGATACSVPTEGPDTPDERPAQIFLTRDSVDVIPGWKALVKAFVINQPGQLEAAPVTWESSDPSVATLTDDSLVQGRRVGRATLTARMGKASRTVTIVVRPRDGVLTLAGNVLYDLALDGSPPVVWPVQPTTLPNDRVYAGFRSGFDWSETGKLLYVCGDVSVCVVAPSGATEVVNVPSTRLAGGASWWSDGRRILYGGKGRALIFDPDTRTVDTTFLPEPPISETPISIRVARDGISLAFSTLEPGYEENEAYETVWVRDARGTRMVRGCSEPDWSLDGKWLASVCGRQVYLEPSTIAFTAFSLPLSAHQVRWDPSGQLLAILGQGVLTLADRDGTGQIFWTSPSHLHDEYNLAWRRR